MPAALSGVVLALRLRRRRREVDFGSANRVASRAGSRAASAALNIPSNGLAEPRSPKLGRPQSDESLLCTGSMALAHPPPRRAACVEDGRSPNALGWGVALVSRLSHASPLAVAKDARPPPQTSPEGGRRAGRSRVSSRAKGAKIRVSAPTSAPEARRRLSVGAGEAPASAIATALKPARKPPPAPERVHPLLRQSPLRLHYAAASPSMSSSAIPMSFILR